MLFSSLRIWYLYTVGTVNRHTVYKELVNHFIRRGLKVTLIHITYVRLKPP